MSRKIRLSEFLRLAWRFRLSRTHVEIQTPLFYFRGGTAFADRYGSGGILAGYELHYWPKWPLDAGDELYRRQASRIRFAP